MNFLHDIFLKVKKNRKRIILPEGTEERILRAADKAMSDNIADIILIGDEIEIEFLAKKYKLKFISQINKIDPVKNKNKELYISLLMKLRKGKITIDEAVNLVKNPLYLACLMIKNGDADGEIAGAINTTGDVLRPAFQIIKTASDVHVVSGAFLMITKKLEYGENGVFLFADCAVIPNPNVQELAEIAISSAKTMKKVMNVDPRVALLSFSTNGSAFHESILKITEAVRLAKSKMPELVIDGELQADAALVPFIGKRKAPKSSVAGKANVLIFPNLSSGNIAYKLVERLGEAKAIGPILQGMASPVNDLSRGCSVDDIYTMIAVCASQVV